MTDSLPVTQKSYRAHFAVELLNAIPVKLEREFVLVNDKNPDRHAGEYCEGFHKTGVADGNTWWPPHQIQHITWTTEEITDAQTN
jgi:hypothetical protein